MVAVVDVRSIEYINGIPKIEKVAWSVLPLFFVRYGNVYVRSGIFQLPLFTGSVEYTHLQNMYKFDDPWTYIAQKLNER